MTREIVSVGLDAANLISSPSLPPATICRMATDVVVSPARGQWHARYQITFSNA
jgi:hypothetical protein